MRRKTTDQFIFEAREIHGNRYDYSLVEYTTSGRKVTIVCPKHGPFALQASLHLCIKRGCPHCAQICRSAKKRKDNEYFIRKSIQKHGNIYDYSKVVYLNNKTNVEIICVKHGSFWQLPINHYKSGCPTCDIEHRRCGMEQFIKRATEKHQKKFDYSRVCYTSLDDKVEILCRIHGPFFQRAMNHINGQGCPKCQGLNKTTQDFVDECTKIHGSKYDYSKVHYINDIVAVCILCKEHNVFFHQTPNGHKFGGNGCPVCQKEKIEEIKKTQRNTLEQVLVSFKKTHGKRYDYSKIVYKSFLDKVEIVCLKHGSFWQSPANHHIGQNCPKCNVSRGEEAIMVYLDNKHIDYYYQYRFDDCRNPKTSYILRFDFYVPTYNCAIEFDGIQHSQFVPILHRNYNNFLSLQERDEIKNQYCSNRQIGLIRITSQKDIQLILDRAFT